jgi:uncharacterized phage protein (TIGR02218 family)
VTRPIELYKVVVDDITYTWTSGDAAVTYLGDTYTPTPLGRGEFEQGQEINRSNLRLSVPVDNALGARYLDQIPDFPAAVTVYRQDDAGTIVLWKGRVAGASASGSEITLDCEHAQASLRRNGLGPRYTKLCRHVLYGRGCNLDHANFATVAQITAVDATGLVLTVPDAAAQADGWYSGGMVAWAGVLRYIYSHAGSSLTLWRPFDGLADDVADAGWGRLWGQYWGGVVPVTLHPGCSRSRSICDSKFSNLVNFGGFPWIPTKTPYSGSSIV